MTNISELLYNFIDANSGLFDLNQYDIDHSMNLELLNYYVSKQTCSRKYFELLKYIYEQSTFIDCRMFEEHYISNINELNEKYGDRELIVLFPYEETEKSNFFLTLYFLYLYKSISGKQINFVITYNKNPEEHRIYIDSLSLTKQPLAVICDDFLYSGEQLLTTIANLPLSLSDDECLNAYIYACIVGMTPIASAKFTKENITKKRTHYPTKCVINVDFPTHSLIIDKTFKTIILKKISEDPNYNNPDQTLLTPHEKQILDDPNNIAVKKFVSENRQVYNYLLLNDMFIIEEDANGDLYAEGQFHKIYNRLNNTLIYLFFKYPDWISTIPEMCALSQYSTNYRFLPENLFKGNLSKFQAWFFVNDDLGRFDKMINRVKIEELLGNKGVYEEIKRVIKEGREKTITINPGSVVILAEKCEGYDFNRDGVSFVTIDGIPRIELIRNLKKSFRTIYNDENDPSLCNNSIVVFYKIPLLQEIFLRLKNGIKEHLRLQKNQSKTTGGSRRKTHSRRNKKQKTRKYRYSKKYNLKKRKNNNKKRKNKTLKKRNI